MFENLKTFTDQGNIGEARAIYEFTRKGWAVSKPLFVNSKYDLVADTGEQLLRVSVKTSYNKRDSGGFEINLATKGGNSTTNIIKTRQRIDYDLLFVLTDDNECYIIPNEILGDVKHSIVVGKNKYNEYKLGA